MSVLMVVTNVSKLGRPAVETGWFVPTVVYPYHAFKKAGLKITFTSPLGGDSPVDPESAGIWDHPICVNTVEEDEEFISLLKNTVPIYEIDPSQYNVIYFTGGHGAMFDCAYNEAMNKVCATIYENGGIVGSCCHGVVGLLNVKLSNGEYLVSGKKLTALTNKEVERFPFAYAFPFKLQDKLIEQGADFQEGIPVKVNHNIRAHNYTIWNLLDTEPNKYKRKCIFLDIFKYNYIVFFKRYFMLNPLY